MVRTATTDCTEPFLKLWMPSYVGVLALGRQLESPVTIFEEVKQRCYCTKFPGASAGGDRASLPTNQSDIGRPESHGMATPNSVICCLIARNVTFVPKNTGGGSRRGIPVFFLSDIRPNHLE